jgi:hypothetical protein
MAMGLRDIFKPTPRSGVPSDAPPETVELDRMLVEELRKFGADLTRPRDTRFFLYFHDHGDAERAEYAVRDLGFDATIEETELERDEQWRLVASRDLVVDDEAIAAIRRDFGKVALANWGTLGGWEVAAD